MRSVLRNKTYQFFLKNKQSSKLWQIDKKKGGVYVEKNICGGEGNFEGSEQNCKDKCPSFLRDTYEFSIFPSVYLNFWRASNPPPSPISFPAYSTATPPRWFWSITKQTYCLPQYYNHLGII